MTPRTWHASLPPADPPPASPEAGAGCEMNAPALSSGERPSTFFSAGGDAPALVQRIFCEPALTVPSVLDAEIPQALMARAQCAAGAFIMLVLLADDKGIVHEELDWRECAEVLGLLDDAGLIGWDGEHLVVEDFAGYDRHDVRKLCERARAKLEVC